MSSKFVPRNLDPLRHLDLESYGPDLLLTWEQSDDAIQATLLVAEIFQEMHKKGLSFRVFDSGLAISMFRDKSTRTRFSFASAANALGLAVADLDEEKSQLAHGETVRETTTMIAFLAETIGIRDDLYLGQGHKYMRAVAQALQTGSREGTLHQRPSLINLQCDLDHPTQTLSDLAKLKTHFGSLADLSGKKLAISWAYSPSYGKPLSVPQGIIALMTRFGMEVTLAHPEGYDLVPEVLATAHRHSVASGGQFEVTHSMEAAFEKADVVYPKSWAPFNNLEQRTALFQAGDREGLKKLEAEGLRQNARYQAWECNTAKMNLTRDGKALYMHCLPADISGVNCEQGEVSQKVFEACRIDTYQEAGFKPFIVAAMIFLARIDNPLERLTKLLKTGKLLK